MKNKYISVTEPFLPPLEEYNEYLKAIWDSKWVTNMGPHFNEYRNKVKDYLNVDGLYPTLNGTTALELAIKTLDIKNKIIITTPFTFVATTVSIINTGNIPYFCDIDNNTGNLDHTLLEDLIETIGAENIGAILPVHVYGEPVNIEAIETIAAKYDLFTIYDAAHCFGTKVNDKGIGQYGNFTIFSTHATKVFNTIEGGLITHKGHNTDIDRILNLSCNFGINENYDLVYPGNNGKMNELQAAMGILQLKYIDENIQKRKRIVNLYKTHLDFPLIFTKYINDVDYSYPYFVIRHQKRDQIEKELLKKGISSRKYFHPISSDYTLIKKSYVYDNEMKVAARLSKEVLAIPLHHNLTEEDVIRISNIINKTVS